MIFVKNEKTQPNKYERAPNVRGLHVLKVKVVVLSVRCSQTTHSLLDFGQGRAGGFCPLHGRGTQTTKDPSTHYNRVIFAGCVEAGWRLSLSLSLSNVEASE